MREEIRLTRLGIRQALKRHDVSADDINWIVETLECVADDESIDPELRLNATMAWNAARRLRDCLAEQDTVVYSKSAIRDYWIAEAQS